MRTRDEVRAYRDELDAEIEGHTESKEWEDGKMGQWDALTDILENHDPYNLDHLKETILRYLGYLRVVEWYFERVPWRFWDEWVGRRYNKYWVWKCPECGSHHIEIRGHNLWTADQNDQGEVNDRSWGDLVQMIVAFYCHECGHQENVTDDTCLDTWHDTEMESPHKRRPSDAQV